MMIAPLARTRATLMASSPGTCSANNGEPKVVRKPWVAARSLMAWGMPCIQPREWPWSNSRSQALASASTASLSRNDTSAFTPGLKR